MDQASCIKSAKIEYFDINEKFIQCKLLIQQNEVEQSKPSQKKNNMLIMVLDKSGSMAGQSFNALLEGARQVVQKQFESNSFQYFEIIFFNDNTSIIVPESYKDYQDKVNYQIACGRTGFVNVFDAIVKMSYQNDPKQISVIMFTDGAETCNNIEQVYKTIEDKQQYFLKKEIDTAYYTIGFTKGYYYIKLSFDHDYDFFLFKIFLDHDAKLLNFIANSGSETGNFIYIDEQDPNCKIMISNGLDETFNLLQFGGSQLNVRGISQEFNQKLNIKKNEINEQESSFAIDKNELQDFKLEITIDKQKFTIIPDIQKINVSNDEITKAQTSLLNLKIFKLVQKMNNVNQIEQIQALNLQIQEIDEQSSQLIQNCFKLSSKLRKQMIPEIQQIKNQIKLLISEVRQAITSNKSSFSNVQIAKLNDMAYKGIRKQGLQKKLDERAIKNQEYYEKLSAQLNEQHQKLNIEQLKQEYKDISEKIGWCQLSCQDVFETIDQKDCLCIALDVGRSEAAIVDPSKLVIKDVYLSFMSSEAFLDFAAFSLTDDCEAHGGFQVQNQGKLVVGQSRENITGVLPLYLFEEHWAIAQKKIAPVLGMMCTLDVMGYQSSQFYMVPYLVLIKTLEKKFKQPNESTILTWNLILDTCKIIMNKGKEFCQNTQNQLEFFLSDPSQRTVDVIPSMKALAAYFITQKELNLNSWTINQIKTFLRVLEEEAQRRCASDISNDNQLLQILNPLWYNFVQDMVYQKSDKDQQYIDTNQIQTFINMFRKKYYPDQIYQNEQIFSQKKQQTSQLNQLDRVDEHVNQCQWQIQLNDENSEAFNYVKKQLQQFDNRNEFLIPLKQYLQLQNEYISLQNQDITIQLAIMLQNSMHYKNSSRREAIQNKTYFEITNKDTATQFLKETYKLQLMNQIKAKEGANQTQFKKSKLKDYAIAFIKSNDIIEAAAYLYKQTRGSGQFQESFKYLLQQKTNLTFEKLKLLISGKFNDDKLVNDKCKQLEKQVDDNCKQYQNNFNWFPKQQNVFKIWLQLVNIHKTLTLEQFYDCFPEPKWKQLVSEWQKQF